MWSTLRANSEAANLSLLLALSVSWTSMSRSVRDVRALLTKCGETLHGALVQIAHTFCVHIEKGAALAGIEYRTIRDLLRRVSPWGITASELSRIGGLSESDAEGLFVALSAGGYIDSEGSLTENGNALRTSRLTTVRRETAQRHLDEMLARVVVANGSDRWSHWVEEVVQFGSMLDATLSHVGDVDIALRLTPRRTSTQEAEYKRKSVRGEPRGETEECLLRHLKARSTILSLCDTRDPVLREARVQILYQRPQGNLTPDGHYGCPCSTQHPDGVVGFPILRLK